MFYCKLHPVLISGCRVVSSVLVFTSMPTSLGFLPSTSATPRASIDVLMHSFPPVFHTIPSWCISLTWMHIILLFSSGMMTFDSLLLERRWWRSGSSLSRPIRRLWRLLPSIGWRKAPLIPSLIKISDRAGDGGWCNAAAACCSNGICGFCWCWTSRSIKESLSFPMYDVFDPWSWAKHTWTRLPFFMKRNALFSVGVHLIHSFILEILEEQFLNFCHPVILRILQ